VRALLAQLDGARWLATSLLYATGMRLLEEWNRGRALNGDKFVRSNTRS
jgi:hypothetical protein